ncbi:MAG: Hsp20/alpha crystallin family protein [Thaumarchaeota archaeon]|nr:MAG: Hsp20/alpha crystallin family protein [Nitrososphaerota archaeon]
MEQDIDTLLNKLKNAVVNISVSGLDRSDKNHYGNPSKYEMDALGIISVKLSTKTSFLEDSIDNNLKVSPPSPYIKSSNEPLIDVLDSPDNLKIVALLPGVRKEDISFNLKEGFIELVIKKGSQIYRKEIPCEIRPTKIITESVNYNNSILEIVFKKKLAS